jgi:hypothetical protein
MTLDWQRLEREVRRVHTRYQREVVEALGLCPWAKESRSGGTLHMHVSFSPSPDASAALELIEVTMASPHTVIGILVFPVMSLDRLAFSHFLAALRELQSARADRRFALADFHPNAASDTTTPERLVPLLRRAPDPMLQIVQTQLLERLRQSDDQGKRFIDPNELNLAALADLPVSAPSLAARIARSNARTVERFGVAQLEQLIADILRDRDASYAALGLAPPTWSQRRDKQENPDS